MNADQANPADRSSAFAASWLDPTRRWIDRTSVRKPGVRIALSLGFTAVFGLWLTSGYQLLRNLVHIEDNLRVLEQSYIRGEQTLLKVRTNVLLGSIYLRDALIDNASPRRDYYRAELTRLRDEIESDVSAYLRQAAPSERTEWERLRGELADYWASRELAFTDTTRTPTEAYLVLRQRVVPRRDGVLQIVDQLSALQAVARRRQELQSETLYETARSRVIEIGVITLVGAFGAALLASRHVSRLQRQVEQQRLGEQEVRRDLERLSARLVDLQERERREISRELHDAVGQALTAVKMDIGVALRGNLSDRARTALTEAREITESTLHNVRDLSQLLHPSMLDDFGLPETLRAYLKRFTDRTGIHAQLVATIDHRLPAEIEACLFRIIQEAKNNNARHSVATASTVTIRARGADVQVVVDDNGRGFQRSKPRDGHGLGLIAMRERAQAQGGSFAISSRPGGGTQVVITLTIPTLTHNPSHTAEAG